jgi:hypothetical protein
MLNNRYNVHKSKTKPNAKRSINANPEKRGKLKELLITNQINNQEYVRAI